MQLKLYTPLLLLLFFACKDEPLPDPCNDTGYTLTENGCECLPPAHSAYGTCRELQENEWYGVTTGCPCEDTLFLKLNGLVEGNSSYMDILINEDVNVDHIIPREEAWRITASPYVTEFFPSSAGDSLGKGSFTAGFLACPLEYPGVSGEWQYTTISGRFTPDRSEFNGHIYYHPGSTYDRLIDSCAIQLTR